MAVDNDTHKIRIYTNDFPEVALDYYILLFYLLIIVIILIWIGGVAVIVSGKITHITCVCTS